MAMRIALPGLPRPTDESQTVMNANPVTRLARRLTALDPESPHA